MEGLRELLQKLLRKTADDVAKAITENKYGALVGLPMKRRPWSERSLSAATYLTPR